jgi:hypothetical protein
MSKLNQDEITAARQALDDHTEGLRPTNTLAASTNLNRYDLMPNRTTLPAFNVHAARTLAHERMRLNRELTTAEREVILKKFSGA